MKKINFIFAVHNHQPVGNFEWVFEKAYRESYLPFVDVLSSHPRVQISLHYSGVLYDWIEEVHPELFKRVGEMIDSGQIELLGGAYYEPILPLIPDRDKIGQIKSYTSRLKERFNVCPTGMWLAERVWEPSLARPISQAGVSWTLIDDIHFKAAGLRDEELFGYYTTEEEGFLLRLFPISQALRYLIPFASRVDEVIDYLRGLATLSDERLIVLGDDGEKFGLWPQTHEWVYKKGWLDKFFTALEENQDGIKMWGFEEWINERGPLGRVYLPTSSYQEMGEWALPARTIPLYEELIAREKERGEFEQSRGFLKGGFHRNFLVKYTEANLMHKKMLYVSHKIDQCPPGAAQVEEARRHLYKAQCNCAYWHGVFGGLYLPHLRRAIYHHLIEAESMADEILHPRPIWLDYEACDFDKDGYAEIMINTPKFCLYLDPREGGCLFELDHKGKKINLLDTLTRRPEAYHRGLLRLEREKGQDAKAGIRSIHELMKAKEEGLSTYLVYDRYRRSSLLDHFFAPKTSLREFAETRYDEWGDFISGSYGWTIERKKKGISLILEREGKVRCGERDIPLLLAKRLILSGTGTLIEIEYKLLNLSSSPFEGLFGIEFNLAPLVDQDEETFLEKDRVCSFELKDGECGLKILFQFKEQVKLWQFPVYTVSQSEGGFERIRQCVSVLPHWHLSLAPGDLWKRRLSLQILEDRGQKTDDRRQIYKDYL